MKIPSLLFASSILLLLLLSLVLLSMSTTAEAKRDKKSASTSKTTSSGDQQQQQQDGEDASDPLIGSPAARLNSIDEFRKLVMETTLPVLLFLGTHKPSTKQALRDNVTAAAIALERHVVSYYINLATPVGKEFLGSIGMQAGDETPRIFLWNPDYIKQEGGYGKQPAQFTGSTSPYGIVRWFMAMLSRKSIDVIEDVEDLVAFKQKYKQFSLPKVILVTGSNFTSPIFTTMSHQFKALAHFGVVTSVSRKAYENAMEIFEKEERELRKVKDLNLGLDSSSENSDENDQQQQKNNNNQKTRHLPHNFAIHDESEISSQNSAHLSEEKKDAAHSELLHVLGCQSIPAIITASSDLGDVEVHAAGSTMNMDKLLEIVSGHALSQDQFKNLFGQVLEYEFALEKHEQQLAREQKKNAKKNGNDNTDKNTNSNNKNSNSNNNNFQPIVVSSPDVWKQNCPHKKSGTLCIAVFSEDLQGNILKYEAKVAELAKGIKKIQDKNRNGYESVKLMLFENNEQNLKLAKVWSAADGIFPQVVYVNPNKGSYHNHVGSFSGSSMSDFVLGQMKTVRAKTFNKEQVLNDFFGGDDEEKLKKQKAQEAAEAKKKKAEEEKRKQHAKLSPEQREKLELEESINSEDL